MADVHSTFSRQDNRSSDLPAELWLVSHCSTCSDLVNSLSLSLSHLTWSWANTYRRLCSKHVGTTVSAKHPRPHLQTTLSMALIQFPICRWSQTLIIDETELFLIVFTLAAVGLNCTWCIFRVQAPEISSGFGFEEKLLGLVSSDISHNERQDLFYFLTSSHIMDANLRERIFQCTSLACFCFRTTKLMD